jgi:hypothetical protein
VFETVETCFFVVGDLEGKGGCQQSCEQGHEGAHGAHASGHSDVRVSQQHGVNDVNDSVGALNVRPGHKDALSLPLKVVAWKIMRLLVGQLRIFTWGITEKMRVPLSFVSY